jgi:hypothetical protein
LGWLGPFDLSHLACAGLGFAAPALTLRWILNIAWRPVATAHAYREAAWRLGLGHDTRGTTLYGDVGGRAFRIEPEGSGVVARMSLRHPLGLGLNVRRLGARERLIRRRERSRTEPLRDYEVLARWPAGDPPLDDAATGALTALTARWPFTRVDDGCVEVRTVRGLGREGDVLDLIGRIEAVAEALERARDALPDPPEVSAFDAHALASGLGLAVGPGPRLTGERGGATILVDVSRREDHFSARVRVRVAQPMRTGLYLTSRVEAPNRRGVAGLRVSWSHQDIPFGDARFDQMFRIQAWDRDTVAERLTPTVCEALVGLADRGLVEANDREVTVLGLPVDDAQITAAVLGALSVAAALESAPVRS